MENPEKIGNIYDKETSQAYYDVTGKDLEEKVETGAEKLLDSLIPENLDNKNVLDLGCGDGRYSEMFCKRGARHVLAMDLSDSMLEQAKVRKSEKQLSQMELVQADMNNLPIGKDKLDFIFSRFSLMYSSNMEDLVQELSDSLHDDGEIVAEVNTVTRIDGEQEKESEKKFIPIVLSIRDKKVKLQNFPYTMEEYMKSFEKAGLRVDVIEEFPADNLSMDESYPDRDKIKLSYVIFKLKKEV